MNKTEMTAKAEAKCLRRLVIEFPSCLFVSSVIEEFTTKAHEGTKLPKHPRTFWILSPEIWALFQALARIHPSHAQQRLRTRARLRCSEFFGSLPQSPACPVRRRAGLVEESKLFP